MRQFLALALVLIPFLALGEEIRDFRVEIEIGEDGLVRVTEDITVLFDMARHGIVREIPVSYRLPTGERYKLRVMVEEVLADGAPIPVQRATETGNLVLRIGDPDQFVQGLVTYTIRYRMARALRAQGDEVELYWNAIGTDWEMPIARAQVLIRLPPAVPRDSVRTVAYRGGVGSREPFLLSWTEAGLTGEAALLYLGEGITVAVRLPKDYVHLSGAWQSFLWFLEDNLYAGIPVLVLVGMFVLWWKRGRDPKLGSVAPEYNPPEGVGPAEAGVLIDNRADQRDFAAGILSLATKGWLKIREVWRDEGDREPADFEFVATEGKTSPTVYEAALREALLGGEKSRQVSDLKYKLYEKMPGLSARLYMDLADEGFYIGSPDGVRRMYYGVGIALIVLAGFLGFFTASLYLGLALGASGVIVIIFAPFMPKRSGKGMEVLRRVLGLQEYIRRAEVDRIEFDARERHFNDLLPYAMALGLTDLWTKKFEGLLTKAPDWYEGRFPTFAPYYLGTRLLTLQHAAYTAATAAPRSSGGKGGWRGGSAFGGGGGFSGGGMGGGGGRAW